MRLNSKLMLVTSSAFLSLSIQAGVVHERVNNLLNSSDWKCSVRDTRVIDVSEHRRNLCLYNTQCISNSGQQDDNVVPCQAQEGSDECPTLRQCIKNALNKSDTTVSTFATTDKIITKIYTKEGVCEIPEKIRMSAGIFWVEGEGPASKWSAICAIPTVCSDNGVYSSRYATFCKPKLDSNSKVLTQEVVLNGKLQKVGVCPNLQDCYDKQISPRDPKTQYSTRNNGTSTTASTQSGHR